MYLNKSTSILIIVKNPALFLCCVQNGTENAASRHTLIYSQEQSPASIMLSVLFRENISLVREIFRAPGFGSQRRFGGVPGMFYLLFIDHKRSMSRTESSRLIYTNPAFRAWLHFKVGVTRHATFLCTSLNLKHRSIKLICPTTKKGKLSRSREKKSKLILQLSLLTGWVYSKNADLLHGT